MQFDVRAPHGTPASEIQTRNRAEASAASALAENGHLVRLWKAPATPGEAKALGLYHADSEQQLTGLLEALPLYDWMRVTVTALEPHPNDPAVEATVADVAARQT